MFLMALWLRVMIAASLQMFPPPTLIVVHSRRKSIVILSPHNFLYFALQLPHITNSMERPKAVQAKINIATITSHNLCTMLVCLVTRCPSMKTTTWIFSDRTNGTVKKSATQAALQSAIFGQCIIINIACFGSIVTRTCHR